MTDFSPENRRNALWSTEAAAALGVSRYKTPVKLWAIKRGMEEEDDIADKFAVRLGLAMQAPMAKLHTEDTGDKLVPLATVEHRVTLNDAPLGAHYDEYNETRKALHEIKFFGERRRKDFGEPGTDEIPMDVLVQVLHQQSVWLKQGSQPIGGTEINVAFGNRERLVFYVAVDTETLNQLALRLSEFWKSVTDGVSPLARSVDDLLTLFPQSKKGTKIVANEIVEAACRRLAALRAAVDECEERIGEHRLAILGHMKDADDLLSMNGGRTLATWRTAAGAVKIDTEKLRAEQPAIAQQYSKAGAPTRRFLLK